MSFFDWLAAPRVRWFTLAAVALGMIAAASGRLAVTGSLINDDAVIYFAQVRSIVLDRDANITNEVERLARIVSEFTGRQKINAAGVDGLFSKTAGHHVSWYGYGTAVLFAPFFLAGHLIALAAHAVGLDVDVDGYGRLHQFACMLGSVFFAIVGTVLLARLAAAYFDRTAAYVASLAILVATPIPFYVSIQPMMAHTPSFFLMTAFLFHWQRTLGERSFRDWALLGALAGLVPVTRYEQSILWIVLAYDLIVFCRALAGSRREVSAALLGAAAFLAPFVAIIALQLYLNAAHFGGAFRVGYGTINAGGPLYEAGIVARFLAPDFAGTFFSPYGGFVTWTPILGVALLGLLAASIQLRDAPFRLMTLGLCIQIYFLGMWGEAGDSFGSRYLVGSLALFGLGLAWAIDRLARSDTGKAAAVAGCIIFAVGNGSAIAIYILTRYVPQALWPSWFQSVVL